MPTRDFFPIVLALLLFASPLLQVVRCHSGSDVDAGGIIEVGDLGTVGDIIQGFHDAAFNPAPGVDTVCLLPKNSAHLVTGGEETEVLVGISNEGQSTVKVIAIRASLHFPFDHQMLVQNLTIQEFFNASIPFSTQAAFPYRFAVSKYLQSGSFDLVGIVIYEVDQHSYQSVFYNGTIEVVEVGSLFNIESVFLVTLGFALIMLSGLWVYIQIQKISKRTKRVVPKVEVGTRTSDASMDEWLQGTAYAQSLSNKSKKKKM